MYFPAGTSGFADLIAMLLVPQEPPRYADLCMLECQLLERVERPRRMLFFPERNRFDDNTAGSIFTGQLGKPDMKIMIDLAFTVARFGAFFFDFFKISGDCD